MCLSVATFNLLFFFFQAYMKEGEFQRSKEWFRKAQNYEPNNRAIKDALVELDRWGLYGEETIFSDSVAHKARVEFQVE